MTALDIPRRHFVQPQGRLRVRAEWAQRLGSLIHFSEAGPRDLIDLDANYVLNGSAVRAASLHGIGVQTGPSEGYLESSDALADVSGHVTLISFLPEIAPTQAIFGFIVWDTGTNRYCQVNGSSVANFGGGTVNTGETIYGTCNRTITFRTGETGDSGAIFLDRNKYAVAGYQLGTGGKTVRLGAYSGGGTANQFSGVFGSAAMVRGLLTDEEVREWVANPWLAYEADPVRIFSLPAGGGSSQALAASGAATATGYAALAANVALAGVGVAIASGAADISASSAGGLAAAGAAEASGTATPAIDIALSALGLSLASGAAALSAAASGDLAASGSAVAQGAAALAANVTISAAGLAAAAASAGLSAAVLLAGAGAARAAGNATLAAQLAAAAAGAAQATGTATLSGGAAGDLAAGGSAQAQGAAALTLTVRLAAAGAASAQGGASLNAGSAQDLSASGAAQASGAGTVAATVTLTAAGFVQAMGAGYLVVQVDLAAAGEAQASGSATLENADALVLIEMPRWTVDAAGRRWVVGV